MVNTFFHRCTENVYAKQEINRCRPGSAVGAFRVGAWLPGGAPANINLVPLLRDRLRGLSMGL